MVKGGIEANLRNSLPKALAGCWREALAEAIGTFTLVFAGTGAVMVNEVSKGAITHIGISFVFGAVVAALIYSIGHLSGAHYGTIFRCYSRFGGTADKFRKSRKFGSDFTA